MATTELALPKIVEVLAPGGAYEVQKAALREEHGIVLVNAKKLGEITTAEEAETIASFGRLLHAAKSEAEAFYKPYKAAIDELKKPILADEHADVDAYEAEKRRLGTLLTDWNRKVAEAKAEADRKALEEATKKAQEEALLRAIEVEEVEGTEAAEQLLAEPLYVQTPVTLSVQSEKPKGSVSTVSYSAEVVDAMALIKAVADGRVPVMAININQSFLNNQARVLKEAYSIPGTRLSKTATTSFRK